MNVDNASAQALMSSMCYVHFKMRTVHEYCHPCVVSPAILSLILKARRWFIAYVQAAEGHVDSTSRLAWNRLGGGAS
jgi:hypothetical protein